MQKIQLRSIPKRNENIRWREFGTEGILLDPGSGDYAEINEVGIAIWKHIDGQKTVEEIIEELLAHFDADDASLSEDTAEFMEELISRGLLSVVP
jgi:hypothetical protein